MTNYNVLINKSEMNKSVADFAEKQCYFDVAISRLYYCCYQLMMYNLHQIITEDEICEKAHGEGSHLNMIKKFCQTKIFKDQYGDKEAVSFLNHMKYFKDERVTADYKNTMYNVERFIYIKKRFQFIYDRINSII